MRSYIIAAALAVVPLTTAGAQTVSVIVGAPPAAAPAVATFLVVAGEAFHNATGMGLDISTQSPAQALRIAQDCGADALLLASRQFGEGLVAEGTAAGLTPVMTSGRAIVGPPSDPADVSSAPTPARAMEKIADQRRPFVSNPATRDLEMALWRQEAIDPRRGRDDWWFEVSGDGLAALEEAARRNGYTLVDLAAFASRTTRGDLAALFAKGEEMTVTYDLLPVSSERCPRAKTDAARALADWLTGAEGAVVVDSWTIDGEPVFAPIAPAP